MCKIFFIPTTGWFILKNTHTKIPVKTGSKCKETQDKGGLMFYLSDWHRRIPTLLSQQKTGRTSAKTIFDKNNFFFQSKEILEII